MTWVSGHYCLSDGCNMNTTTPLEGAAPFSALSQHFKFLHRCLRDQSFLTLEITGSEDSKRMGVSPKLMRHLFLFVWKWRARVRTVAAAIWPGRCPPAIPNCPAAFSRDLDGELLL